MAQQTIAPQMRVAADQVADTARDAGREAGPGVTFLGRFGLAAKGVVYVLIGVITARAAFGGTGGTIDSNGALERIAQMPFGQVLLAVVMIGLAGYALWRIVQALLDTENKGTDAQGMWARGAYLVSAAIHVTLTLAAARLVFSMGSAGNSDASAQDWTARLLEQPFGPWLVAAIGVGLIGSGGFQLYRALTTKFRDRLMTGSMSAGQQTFAIWAGRFGFSARGVTFAIMGLFLALAAFRRDSGEAKGIAGALNSLTEQPYGPELLGIVAIGLACYGLYMFVEARYRRIVIP